MNHIVDAHVAYIKTIGDLNQDKAELLKRIKRMEEVGDEMLSWLPEDGISMKNLRQFENAWHKAKEAKR